jgi:hypothetical protein
MELIAPDEFIESREVQREKVLRDFYGDAAWKMGVLKHHCAGIDITEAVLIHDWMYAVGVNDFEKRDADRTFLHNMLILVDLSESEMLRSARREVAWGYYMAACKGGWDSFYARKDTRSYFAKAVTDAVEAT